MNCKSSRKYAAPMLLLLALAGCAHAPGQEDRLEVHDVTDSCILVVIGGTDPRGGSVSTTVSPPITVSGLPGVPGVPGLPGLPLAALAAAPPAAPDRSPGQTCTVAPTPAATPSSSSAGATTAVRGGKPAPAPRPVRIIAVPMRLSDSPFYFVHGPTGPLVHYRDQPL